MIYLKAISVLMVICHCRVTLGLEIKQVKPYLPLLAKSFNINSKWASQNIQSTVDGMRRKDYNAARNGDYVLDYQGKVSTSKFDDEAKNPLFSYVNKALFLSPTYQAYEALWPLFNPDVTVADPITSDKAMKIDAFLDAVMNTEVFAQTWTYLQQIRKATGDYTAFKKQLKTLWFGLYARNSNNVLGSSAVEWKPGQQKKTYLDNTPRAAIGFEHVFLGEQRVERGSDIVDGQHHWVRYWAIENNGNIDYHGWIEDYGYLLSTIQYQWAGKWEKRIGGFLVGTTVEFDFSLCTLCALASLNGYDCKYTIDGHNIISVNYISNQMLQTCYPKMN